MQSGQTIFGQRGICGILRRETYLEHEPGVCIDLSTGVFSTWGGREGEGKGKGMCVAIG